MAHARKPHGGYRLLTVTQLCAAWTAYRKRQIPWLALRTYLALHEVAARREAAARCGQVESSNIWARAAVPELRELVRCSRESQVTACLRRLRDAGLVGIDRAVLVVIDHPGCTYGGDMEHRVGRTGRVAVARTVLRHLASSGSPAMAAFMLGVSLRCCYLQSGGLFSARGRCSTAWISEVFGVHQRNVKRAAAMMRSLGWIRSLYAHGWRTQRHGAMIAINLDWRCPGTETPPPTARESVETPPPIREQELLTDPENHQPAKAARGADARVACSPDGIRSLRVSELRDSTSLDRRFRACLAAGLISAGEASRLRFHAAAVHALRVARSNPCGLFASNVRNGRWHHASQADEELARAKLRLLDKPKMCCDPRLERLTESLAAQLTLGGSSSVTRRATNRKRSSKTPAISNSPTSTSSSRMTRRLSTTDSTFSISATCVGRSMTRKDEDARRVMPES